MHTVRPIEDRDKPALRALYRATRASTFFWLELDDPDFDKDTVGQAVFVAICDGCPAGFISILLSERFIHHLYVDEKYQGKKIGTALVEMAVSICGLPIRLKVLVENLNATAFYSILGFTVIEKGESQEGDFLLLELNNFPATSPQHPINMPKQILSS